MDITSLFTALTPLFYNLPCVLLSDTTGQSVVRAGSEFHIGTRVRVPNLDELVPIC